MSKRPDTTKTRKRARPAGRAPKRPVERWHEAVIADYATLRHWPGVQRIGLGLKEVKGRLTRRYCVKIYVARKGDLPNQAELLPAKTRVLLPAGRGMFKTRWVPTDVVTASNIVLCAANQLFNPIRAGAEIGPSGGTERGTLSCLVKDANGAIFGLTAGHVVSIDGESVNEGSPVNQPLNPPPGAGPAQVFLGETSGGSVGNDPNLGYVDWATIGLSRRVDGNRAWDEKFIFGTRIMSEAEIMNGAPAVEKLGAVTGVTSGRLSALFPELKIAGRVLQKVYELISDVGDIIGKPGDSGGLVVNKADRAVIGLLFAVDDPPVPGARGYVFPLARLPKLSIA